MEPRNTREISYPAIFEANVAESKKHPKPIDVLQLINAVTFYISEFTEFIYDYPIVNYEKYDGKYDSEILLYGNEFHSEYGNSTKLVRISSINKKIEGCNNKLYGTPFVVVLSFNWIKFCAELLIVPLHKNVIQIRSVIKRDGNKVVVRASDGSLEDIFV